MTLKASLVYREAFSKKIPFSILIKQYPDLKVIINK